MSYNTVEEILIVGRLSLEDFTQSEVERSIDAAQNEIDLLIPPITDQTDKAYPYYARRLSLIKEAHAYLTLSYLLRVVLFDEATRGASSDFIGVPGVTLGPHTPEKNVQAELYLKLANDYRAKADDLIRRCRYRVPVVKRPKPLRVC